MYVGAQAATSNGKVYVFGGEKGFFAEIGKRETVYIYEKKKLYIYLKGANTNEQ